MCAHYALLSLLPVVVEVTNHVPHRTHTLRSAWSTYSISPLARTIVCYPVADALNVATSRFQLFLEKTFSRTFPNIRDELLNGIIGMRSGILNSSLTNLVNKLPDSFRSSGRDRSDYLGRCLDTCATGLPDGLRHTCGPRCGGRMAHWV